MPRVAGDGSCWAVAVDGVLLLDEVAVLVVVLKSGLAMVVAALLSMSAFRLAVAERVTRWL